MKAFYATREILDDIKFCEAYNLPMGLRGKTLILQGFG
jgi:hypothetical protein